VRKPPTSGPAPASAEVGLVADGAIRFACDAHGRPGCEVIAVLAGAISGMRARFALRIGRNTLRDS